MSEENTEPMAEVEFTLQTAPTPVIETVALSQLEPKALPEQMPSSQEESESETLPHPSPSLFVHSLIRRLYSDSLLRNSVYLMGTTVATAAMGYLYWIVATHLYAAHDIGLASALIATVTLTSTLASLGVGPTLVQMLPRCQAGYTWSLTLNAGLAMGTVTSWLASIIMVVALPLFSQQFVFLGNQAAFALVLMVSPPLWTIAALLDQVFVAERAADKMLVRNVAFALLKFPFLVLLAKVGTVGIFFSWVLALAATLIGGGLLVPRLRRAYRLVIRGILGQVRVMLSSFAWQHFISLGVWVPIYLMPVFVTVRLSAADNAYYYTTSMVGGIFFMVSPAVAASLFAEGSHVADGVLRNARFSAVIIGVLLVPAMLISFLGGRYILLVFGPDYAEHGLLLLMILTVAAVPDGITNIYLSVLRVQGRLRRAAMLNLGMAALTLVLAWILLPIQGIVADGWAFLIAQVAGSLVAGVDLISIHRHQRHKSEPAMQSDACLGKPWTHTNR